MDAWLDRFADDLHVAHLEPEEVDAVLDLARVVAHGTERKNAPLAAFLAGRWAAMAGGDVTEALRRAQALLPPAG